ncbi:hypothetical protein ElyMa_004884600 [Elysia marginata]|uniref:Uncharacterized protein n=1 Tax=Elysia marginata TaxID=1093978 RepID=A0AAV4IVM4_9GAST|nr:hypothetical protein ElyMa_004884600 [Elysia marginata]
MDLSQTSSLNNRLDEVELTDTPQDFVLNLVIRLASGGLAYILRQPRLRPPANTGGGLLGIGFLDAHALVPGKTSNAAVVPVFSSQQPRPNLSPSCQSQCD